MDDFINNLVYNGEVFNITRNDINVGKCRALWKAPLSSGALHLIFLGKIDLHINDMLTSEEGNNFFITDTFIESREAKPYKRHVFCETETNVNKRKYDNLIQEVKYWVPVIVSNFIALIALIVTILSAIN